MKYLSCISVTSRFLKPLFKKHLLKKIEKEKPLDLDITDIEVTMASIKDTIRLPHTFKDLNC